MKKLLLLLVLSVTNYTFAQKSLDALLKKENKQSIPYVSVEETSMLQKRNTTVLLDAREKKEYVVSHLNNAIWVGYDTFSMDSITIKDKNTPIIVYCSLGIRSEDVAEQLKKEGYTNVKNLYGGIFEWKNKTYPVVNFQEKETDSVHAFSPEWGKWLTNGIKVYE